MRDRLPFFDEMLGSGEAARDPYASYHGWFSNEDLKDLRKKSTDAETFSAAPASPSTSMARPRQTNA
jgi:uncharacterized circularly permuted ATP-grasp superfamily protein